MLGIVTNCQVGAGLVSRGPFTHGGFLGRTCPRADARCQFLAASAIAQLGLYVPNGPRVVSADEGLSNGLPCDSGDNPWPFGFGVFLVGINGGLYTGRYGAHTVQKTKHPKP